MKYKKTPEEWQKDIDEEQRIHNKQFRDRAQKIYDRWTEENNRKGAEVDRVGSKFNILYSNTSVIHSAVYAGDSRPDVRRRYRDSDADARQLAELMERALEYSNDEENLSEKIDFMVDDYLVAGLGIPRLRYVPAFEDGVKPKIPVTKHEIEPEPGSDNSIPFRYEATPEGGMPYDVLSDELENDEEGNLFIYGEPEQTKVWESVEFEIHPWNRFGWQPTHNWENCNWIYFEHFLDKEDVRLQFGAKVANRIPYGYDHKGDKGDDNEERKTHARIYEVYDKSYRKLCIFAHGDDRYIEEVDDPLKLQGFYPVPRPLMANLSSTKLIPIPDYIYYQDQARELDKLTFRIERLTEALKLRGAYDASFPQLQDLFNSGDNQMMPVHNFEKLENKGFDDIMKILPVEEVARVLMSLIEKREEVKQTIYEITGISDILRGATKPSETLGAQHMKQMNAGARIGRKDRPIENTIREMYRLKIEVMLEHFDPETLEIMTGVKVTPQMIKIMRDDMLRCYKISVETEATIAQDAAQDQKNRIEVIGAITQFVAQVGPMVQAGVIPIQLAKEILLFGIRGFKQGRQLEHLLEALGQNEQQQPGINSGLPGPEAGAQSGMLPTGQQIPEMGLDQIGPGIQGGGFGDAGGYPQ